MCLWSISWLCVFPAVARPALLLCGSQHGQVVEAPWCTLLSVSLQTRGLVPLLRGNGLQGGRDGDEAVPGGFFMWIPCTGRDCS